MFRRLALLPIRVRLTLISAAVITVLFGVLAWVLFLQFQGSVNSSVDSALRARADELMALSHRRSFHPVALPSERGDFAAFFQVLSPAGRILDASAGHSGRPLLRVEQRRLALTRPTFIDRGERSRLYALQAPDGDMIVAGVSLDGQQDASIAFRLELLIGTPLMAVIAAIITYVVSGKLLAPVADMRREAARISTKRLDARLPLPTSIDEIHHLASTLNTMLDRLHDGVARELRFVSDASHELRTPLTALRGELEVALHVDGTREQYRAAVASAMEETELLITLSENLLTLARAQDSRISFRAERVTAEELMQRVADRARLLHGAAVTVREDRTGATVLADPVWLEQALLNLVHNAHRHGGGTVVLDVTSLDGVVELHVQDCGPGFPPPFLPQAFERFSRGDAARTRGGAGLGLAIVATVAKAHDGQAHARNRAGGGADVWITLPGGSRRP
jgi:signal transduction histidine kinase